MRRFARAVSFSLSRYLVVVVIVVVSRTHARTLAGAQRCANKISDVHDDDLIMIELRSIENDAIVGIAI